MKIDIITFHDTANYGATLQCCALSKYLRQQGCEVEVVNYLPYYVQERKQLLYKSVNDAKGLKGKTEVIIRNLIYFLFFSREIKRKIKRYDSFICNNLNLTKPYYDFRSLEKDPPQADLILCGSDQIWNPTATGGSLDEAFFAAFTDIRKASYGASLGELNIAQYENDLKKLTKDFEAISVREKSIAGLLSEVLGQKVDVVLDCTLLLDREEYASMESKALKTDGPYLLLYALEQSETTVNVARKEAKIRGLKLINIALSPLKKLKGADNLTDVGPAEFLSLFKNASFVVTNSFHGTAFSIIYKREFITIPHTTRSARMVDLLISLKLEDRIVRSADYDEKTDIDYDRVDVVLNELRKHSVDYIKAITSVE